MKSLTTIKFDPLRVTKFFKHAFATIVFASLIFILQSCAVHYVSDVPVSSVEVRSASPYAGAVWIDGGWGYRGGSHYYTNGYWDHPRNGRTYQAGEWRSSPRGHYYVRGRWR